MAFGRGCRALVISGLLAVLVAAAAEGAREGVLRSRPVSIDTAALARARTGESVSFELFDRRSVQGTVDRRRERSADRFTVAGSLADGGSFVVAVNDGAVAGLVQEADGTTYRIRARGELEQLDAGGVFTCSMGEGVPALDLQAAPGGAAVAGDCDDGSVIDVLFVYTRQGRNHAGGVDEIEAEIDLSVEYNNIAFDNSLVETQWHPVFVWELDPNEDPSLGELTNPNDGVVDGVHDLRDAYGADQVALIDAGGGGVANGMWTFEEDQADLAFCWNGLDSFPFVVSHEIGHNLGCCHAIGDGGGCPGEGGLLFIYSNGHRFTGDSGELWHTIMAYSPGTLFQHFSNPDVLWDGQPTGIPGKSQGDADNALTINLSKYTVSNWRCNDGICEALDLPSDGPDCNENEMPDECEIALGLLEDADGNGIPDVCEDCPDFDGDGMVSTSDLLTLLGAWGPNPGHPADLDGDGVVSTSDLLTLLAKWGPCV
jgi:hypothetical protein